MQVRIRKKRYNRITRELSGVALTGFRNALVLLSLTSCSLFSTHQKTVKDLMKVCLSAEGRGRLEHSRGRHLFEFESLLDKKTRKWSLGLDLPIIGQELLYFEYPPLKDSKTTVTGTFATRLKLDITSKKKTAELSRFYSMMGELLSIIDTGVLRKGWELQESSSKLVLEKKLGQGEVFTFEALQASKYYERLNLSLQKKNKFNKYKGVMKMNLFLSRCSG